MRNLKKILALVLSCLMILALVACGQTEPTKKDTKNDPPATVQDEPKQKPDNEVVSNETNDPEPQLPEDETFDPGPLEVPEGGIVIETNSGPGARLQDSVPEVQPAIYDYSNPVSVDDEFGYNNYEMTIKLTDSSLTTMMHGLGEFEDMDSFQEVWIPYAQGMMSEVNHGGLMTDVAIYGEESNGDHLFGSDEKQSHSFSLGADLDGYQSVNYTYVMFVATDEESWDLYDYSDVVSYIQHYTGITLTTGDIRAMQEIIAEHLDAGEQTWTVQVQSNERDNYDNFRITGSVFTDNSQSWHFVGEHMISKWADLYER